MTAFRDELEINPDENIDDSETSCICR